MADVHKTAPPARTLNISMVFICHPHCVRSTLRASPKLYAHRIARQVSNVIRRAVSPCTILCRSWRGAGDNLNGFRNGGFDLGSVHALDRTVYPDAFSGITARVNSGRSKRLHILRGYRDGEIRAPVAAEI